MAPGKYFMLGDRKMDSQNRKQNVQKWMNIAIVFNNTQMLLYVDGELVIDGSIF